MPSSWRSLRISVAVLADSSAHRRASSGPSPSSRNAARALTDSERSSTAAGQNAGVYDGEFDPDSGAAVELKLPQRPAASGREPGRLMARFERLVEVSDPAVYLPGPLQDPFGPLLVTAFEHGGDLLQHRNQLTEDGGRSPLDQALGVDGEEVVDRERHPASDERVDEAIRREDGIGRLQHDHEDRRDGSLVDQHGPSSEEHRSGHSQEHDDGDLERPVPYHEH